MHSGRNRGYLKLMMSGALLAFAPVLLAQTALPAAEAASRVGASPGGMTAWEMIQCGGWVMYVIAALSILALTLVIYLFAILRVQQIAPRPLHRDLIEKIRAGQMDDARRACEYHACPLSAVTLVALEYLRNMAQSQSEPVLLKDVMEGEGQRQAESIQGQIQYLLDVAVVAPMAGFLGTVLGMLKAFNAVAMDVAKATPMVLASGVTQALITTVFGLIVAIPAMIFYAYFRRRASSMVSLLEAASMDVMTAMASKRMS